MNGDGEAGDAALSFDAALHDVLPRVLAAVTKRCGDFAAAEDAVQDALLAAVAAWPRDGVPTNPAGWLFTVALRRLADANDAEQARRRREEHLAQGRGEPFVVEPGTDEQLAEVGDETLALLFACCHPALAPSSSIPLMLRALCGLSTAAIARALLVPEATLAQRIVRAKQTIAGSGVPLLLPPADERERRFGAVLQTIYLLGNEGHLGGDGDEAMRLGCADEAIRLARLCVQLVPGHAEAEGLLALLLLTESRRAARQGPAGELIPLDEQDRTRWDRAQIAEGTALVTRAFARGLVGSYQLQAAIAALHAEAPDVERTDWPQIEALYTVLARLQPGPVVALNRAVAVAMVHGAQAGLAEVERLAADPQLAAGHRLLAVRGHLLQRAGERAAARAAFERAAEKAVDPAERAFLRERAARLGG